MIDQTFFINFKTLHDEKKIKLCHGANRMQRHNKAKLAFEMLEKEMEILTPIQARLFRGGSGIEGPLYISGGYLIEEDGGTYFYGNNGSCIFFAGVEFSTSMVANDTAYQLNGTIHISEDWASNGFDIHDFAHEYGHYLRQQEMGNWDYYTKVAIPSIGTAGDPDHNQQPYEVDATNRGETYLNNNWSNC